MRPTLQVGDIVYYIPADRSGSFYVRIILETTPISVTTLALDICNGDADPPKRERFEMMPALFLWMYNANHIPYVRP